MKLTIFVALLIGFSIFSTGILAKPISISNFGNISEFQSMKVISQDFVDSQLAYSFDKIDNNTWHASFAFDNASLAIDIKFAFNKQCSHNAWASLNNNYFSEWNMTTLDLCTQIKNMANYPTKAGNHTYITNFKWNQTALGGSFDIIFPNGWVENETLKFGWNSTIVQTYVTATTPLSGSGRAICRTTNRIHAVLTYNGPDVLYCNASSTNVNNWDCWILTNTGTGSDPAEPPVIDCSGNNIFIAWMDTDSRGDINYFNSSDEGQSLIEVVDYPTVNIWRDGTGSSAQAVNMGSVQYGYGNNIWVTYAWDAGTPETIIVDNTSSYGGSSPTVTRKNMGIDCGNSIGTIPSLYVNVSGTTEYVYAPNGCGSKVYLNYTNNSGTNWYSSTIEASAGASWLSIIGMNNTLYFGRPQSGYNSTDGGQTWTKSSANLWYESISFTTANNNLYMFYGCNNTNLENCDVGLDTFNRSSGYAVNDSYIYLNTTYTYPNAIRNTSSAIDFLYFNNSNIWYDNISVTFVDSPPTFSSYSVNTTVAGQPVNFSIIISDDTALSGFIFSTNNTGTWRNTTWVSKSSGQVATNITTLNSTVNKVVNVSWFANDSLNQWSVYRASVTTTSADTCTYTSGDWYIDIKDNCTALNVYVTGTIYLFSTSYGWANFTNVSYQSWRDNKTIGGYFYKARKRIT